VGPQTRVNSTDWKMPALKQGKILHNGKCGPWNKGEFGTLVNVNPETKVHSHSVKYGPWNKGKFYRLDNVGPETRVNSADRKMWALKQSWITVCRRETVGLKGTQAWDILEFFIYLNKILICSW
jgi:hypothetical protein